MKTFITTLLCAGFALGMNAYADGNGNFAKNHPRRAQVRKRINNEKGKNNAAAADGQINQQQDNKLNHQDNRISNQEHAQEQANGGHLTKAEQRQDNRELNHVNKERRNDEHKDAAANGGSAPTTPPAPAAGGQ